MGHLSADNQRQMVGASPDKIPGLRESTAPSNLRNSGPTCVATCTSSADRLDAHELCFVAAGRHEHEDLFCACLHHKFILVYVLGGSELRPVLNCNLFYFF